MKQTITETKSGKKHILEEVKSNGRYTGTGEENKTEIEFQLKKQYARKTKREKLEELLEALTIRPECLEEKVSASFLARVIVVILED